MAQDDQDQQRLQKLRAELKDLSARDKQATPDKSDKHDTQNSDNMRQGMMAGTEFVGAIIVGGVIGYVLDVVIGTWPVFFLIWLLLGIVTGFYNIYRITNNIDIQSPFQSLHEEQKKDKTHSDNRDDS